MVKLTSKQLRDLKSSIGSLRKGVLDLHKIKKPRDLTGNQGILARTLGDKFKSPVDYNRTYFDKRRKGNALTEFVEFLIALKKYDKEKTQKNAVGVYLEVGDIVFQKEVAKIMHKNHPKYWEVIKKFDIAISFIKKELKKRGLSFAIALKLTKIKYRVMSWLGIHGFISKERERKKEYKDLEKKLSLEALKNTQ